MHDRIFPPRRPFAAPPSDARPLGVVTPPDTVDALPVLADARDHLLEVGRRPHRPAELVTAVEGDPALLLRALRLANRMHGRARTVGSARSAVGVLGVDALVALSEGVPVFDPLSFPDPQWGLEPQRFRAHAGEVRAIVERLGDELGVTAIDDVRAAAVLHDVGRLALHRSRPGYADVVAHPATPERRVMAERDAFGADHAEVGGWLARRWLLPERLASAIEYHHDDRLGPAAIVRLADMLAHVRRGEPVDGQQVATTAMVAGVALTTVRGLLHGGPGVQPRAGAAPNPLSEREVEVLRALSEGKLPKQVAHELGLSEKTVRNHLHRIYRRIGAADRTQAVLKAREESWI